MGQVEGKALVLYCIPVFAARSSELLLLGGVLKY